MKRTFKRPDGTEEVVEGSAEELAEYERRLREGSKAPGKGKKPVLHGAAVDGEPLTDDEVNLVRLSRHGFLQKITAPIYIPQYVPYVSPIKCWFCGTFDCHQTHIWYGTTSNTLQLSEDPTAGNVLTINASSDVEAIDGFEFSRTW